MDQRLLSRQAVIEAVGGGGIAEPEWRGRGGEGPRENAGNTEI